MPRSAPPRDPLQLPDVPPRLWIGGVYVVLFLLSVPWYLPESDPVPIWLGLPYWVVISIVSSVGVALFTALIVTRCWPVDPDAPRVAQRNLDTSSTSSHADTDSAPARDHLYDQENGDSP
jgi:hypothetical protein